MREKERIERILKVIQKYWEAHQDFRFFQMLINLGLIPNNNELWHMSDNKIEDFLKEQTK